VCYLWDGGAINRGQKGTKQKEPKRGEPRVLRFHHGKEKKTLWRPRKEEGTASGDRPQGGEQKTQNKGAYNQRGNLFKEGVLKKKKKAPIKGRSQGKSTVTRGSWEP